MPLSGYEKHPLTEKWKETVKDFDCCISKNTNFQKLNDFLIKDALEYNQNNVSRTNIFVKDGVCVAYYSLAMNAIKEQRITVEDKYRALKSYPALFLTRIAVDKHFQRLNIGKAILNDIIKHAYENTEIAARFLFLDAYPESISWYLKNSLFEIMYTDLTERIEYNCEKKIIDKLNLYLKEGHNRKWELINGGDLDILRVNCEKILTTYVNDIFNDIKSENPLLEVCNSKVKLIFENNKPKIKLDNFNTRHNLPRIRNWLSTENNLLNLDITIPIYLDINQYYRALYG